MNKKELEEILIMEKIPQNMYSVKGGLLDQTYCLDKDYDGWVIYYTERGEIINRQVFKTEEEACEHFYRWIKKIMKLTGK